MAAFCSEPAAREPAWVCVFVAECPLCAQDKSWAQDTLLSMQEPGTLVFDSFPILRVERGSGSTIRLMGLLKCPRGQCEGD